MICPVFRRAQGSSRSKLVMEMEELSFYQHFHMNPLPSPSSASGQEAFYYDYPPFAAAITKTRDNVVPIPQQPSRQKAAVMARKDRHSKICTAGGMRDRRMRLSFDVARRFFALQDKLGFDRASMTLQWLLDMSTTAINGILITSTTSMSLSQEDGSGSVLVADAICAETNNCMPQMSKARRRAPAPRKSNKESRARAREWARERTKERNRLRSSVSVDKEAPVPARQVIPVPAAACSSSFEHVRGSYYNEQEPWELGEIVFAKSRFH